MSFEKVERLSDSESDADQFNLGAGHESSALSDSNDEGRGDGYVPFFAQKRKSETSDDEGANRSTKKIQNRNLSYSQMNISDSYGGFKKHGVLDLNSEVKDSESDADQFSLSAGHDSSALSDSNDEGRGDSYVPFFSQNRKVETSDDEGPTKLLRVPQTKPSSLTDNMGKNQNKNLSYSQMSISDTYGGFKKLGILDLNSEVKDSDSEPEPQALLSGHESTTFSDSNDEGKPELFSGSFSARQLEDSQKDQAANTFQNSQNASYSETSLKIMAKMGYQDGKGLGKNAQGRVEIVEASKQRGRRGFGLYPKAFMKTETKWDPNEEISAIEAIDWMKPCTDPMPSLEELRTWKATGKKKQIIDDELNFISSEMLSGVLNSKNIFDELESEEMRKARSRSNPYETIRGVIFQNRAAMKMANIDAVCDFMLTQPKSKTGQPLVSSNSLLYFADICAGPGGFSEYVLWRRKGDAKGFGLTLRECNDFKLEEFFAGPSEMFEPHYGADGTGDIYKTENQKAFEKFVKENTESKGVHFVMADGGFSVEGQENIQEILSKQLYLCQFLTALLVLRDDGHFVCKLFDIFTPFSVGLVYLMYRAFHQVAIFKPVTSRPANSERYIICKALRTDAEPIKQYLNEINQKLLQMDDDDECDINDVVPLETLLDGRFYEYIRTSNELLAKKQINNLRKIHAFALDTNRHEYSQKDTRKQCLQLWKIPDNVRVAPAKGNPSTIFSKLMEEDCNMYHLTYEDLTPAKLKSLKSLYDYRCYVTGSENRYFILGLGRGHVCFWNGNQSSNWCKIEDKQIHIELPSETLLEAEIVQEFQGEGKGQKKQMTVHVLDAYFLCGDNIQKLHFNERIERLKKFVKAITKTTRSDLAPISVPEIYRMEEIHKIFDRLEMKLVKGQSRFRRLCYCKEKKHYFLPSGIHFVKITKDPWTMCLSKSSNTKYFFDTSSGVSTYGFPADAITNTRDCRLNGIRWKWQEGVKVHDSQPTTQDSDKFSKEDILQFIQDKVNK